MSDRNGSGIVLGIEEVALKKTTFVDFNETQFWKEANKPTNMYQTVVGSAVEKKTMGRRKHRTLIDSSPSQSEANGGGVPLGQKPKGPESNRRGVETGHCSAGVAGG